MDDVTSLSDEAIERRLKKKRALARKVMRALYHFGASRNDARSGTCQLLARLDDLRVALENDHAKAPTPWQDASLLYRFARTHKKPEPRPRSGHWHEAWGKVCGRFDQKHLAWTYIAFFEAETSDWARPSDELCTAVADYLHRPELKAKRRHDTFPSVVAQCCAITVHEFTHRAPTRSVNPYWDSKDASELREYGPFVDLVRAAFDYCAITGCRPESYTLPAINLIKKRLYTRKTRNK